MSNKSYQICEYGVIRNRSDFDSAVNTDMSELYLPDRAFNSLFDFILENQPDDGTSDPPFTLFQKAKKRQIKVKNYVGVIETADGTSIEILPKIHLKKSADAVGETKRIFLRMLSHLRNSPFVNLSAAHLKTQKDFPILEVFIASFTDECERLFNGGVRHDYVTTDNNLNFLRGKLHVGNNIRRNFTNPARFYCEYSEYSEDIPQNRIIKSTLLKLVKSTRDHNNRIRLAKLLARIDSIGESANPVADLGKCRTNDRLNSRYQKILEWSRVFLLGQSFTNFKGHSVNSAILFPMERVFEDYIGFVVSKYANCERIKLQDKSYFLVESHRDAPKFRLKPDIYLENEPTFRMVIDTKWKLINGSLPAKNYNISSADMYQLFAYGKKYTQNSSIPKLVLIYPLTADFSERLDSFNYDQDLRLEVFPWDFQRETPGLVQGVLGRLDSKQSYLESDLRPTK